jgi:hypothetical protein
VGKKKPAETSRISAKQAANSARAYMKSLVPVAADVSVEEAELSEDERFWLITLGYEFAPFGGPKEYKVFKVDAQSGEVLSMKIREGRARG